MPSQFSLPPAEYGQLLEAERQIHDNWKEFDILDQLGIDTSEQRRTTQQMLDRIAIMKANYAPR